MRLPTLSSASRPLTSPQRYSTALSSNTHPSCLKTHEYDHTAVYKRLLDPYDEGVYKWTLAGGDGG